jgi:hypothetical protein
MPSSLLLSLLFWILSRRLGQRSLVVVYLCFKDFPKINDPNLGRRIDDINEPLVSALIARFKPFVY